MEGKIQCKLRIYVGLKGGCHWPQRGVPLTPWGCVLAPERCALDPLEVCVGPREVCP